MKKLREDLKNAGFTSSQISRALVVVRNRYDGLLDDVQYVIRNLPGSFDEALFHLKSHIKKKLKDDAE